MKLFLSTVLLASSLSAHAYILDCQSVTELSCQVTYYRQGQAKQTVTHIAKYEVINWDEPSLAYCAANVGFNQNGLYIEATLTESTQQIQLRMMRASTGGMANDQFSVYGQGKLTGTISLSQANGVYAAEVKCETN